jgi:hypothetical protein
MKIENIKYCTGDLYILTKCGNIYKLPHDLPESRAFQIQNNLILIMLPKNEKAEKLFSIHGITYIITTTKKLLFIGKISVRSPNQNSYLELSIKVPRYLILPNNMKCLKIIKNCNVTLYYTNTNEIYISDNNKFYEFIKNEKYISEFNANEYFTINQNNLILLFNRNMTKNFPFCLLFNLDWNIKNHKLITDKTRLVIKTFLILSLRDKKRTHEDNYKPKYSESLVYLLPRDIILEILQYLPL